MSNLLNIALNHSAKLLRFNTCRLLHRTTQIIKDSTKLTNKCPITRQNCTRAFDVNTNITKDVILFKYENPRFYNVLNIFAICQFVFWTYLSHFAFTTLKDAPVETDLNVELKWYQRINLGENKYRNGITVICFFIGYGVLFAAWTFTLRSVRLLILRKGGKDVTFVTYGPFNKNRIMTVPLKNMSAEQSRELAKTQLPIKVRNKSLFYVLDMRGEFKNERLFDFTAGLKRRIED